ncbi:DNA polymerase nu [Tautogolabrus adspersus]
MGQIANETGERLQSKGLLEQCETTSLPLSDNLERTTEVEDAESRAMAGINRSTEDKIKIEQLCCSDVQLRGKHCETDNREVSELSGGDTDSGDKGRDGDESLLPHEDREGDCTFTEASGRESSSTPTLSQESQAERSGFSAPCLHDNKQTANGGLRGSSSSVVLTPASTYAAGQSSSSVLVLASTVIKPSTEQEESSPPAFKTQPPLIPSFALRVKDSGRMNSEEKMQMLEEAGKAKALVLTLVYRDGTTQLDPEQKTAPPVCGLLLLMMNNLNRSSPENSFGPNDSLVYLKLEHTPAWAQQHTHQSQALFTRDMLLQVLSGSQLVVCFKAKDLLRTALQVYRGDLSWKQVAGCRIQDPQVSGWLLDPANTSSCYNDLLNKHRKTPCVIPALVCSSSPAVLDVSLSVCLSHSQVSQVISRLCLLHWLNMELCSKLQSRGLWQLYSDMEMKMISVLAAMESHRIHVDKDALRRTSDLLGTQMKQLEQEAHLAAGQIFLVTSNAQLRTVLFEKLCLHERCENKKLPKTVNKQQQSTSEAALLQLQDLHPLPKIILEYRQVHKIKSTFVDGILSCMMSKNYISSTWHQTSVVTGRISAKHPNFQALPRQPLQITKKHYIQGKEEEVVTVHPRAMFIPQDGWTFLSADFCQVELRLLAHLSCDPELLRIFINPRADVFAMLASQWKGVSEGEVTSEDREHAKRIVYSVVYGAGRERLSGILGVSAEQASRFQDSFLQTYREVQTFIQKTIQQCHKQGYVLSIMGRRRTLPNINSPDWGVRMQAERQAVNFVVQGSAADLCKMAMIRIFNLVSSSSALSARLLAQLHDELLFEVEDSQVEQFAALVRSIMESMQHIDQHGVHLKVPLKVAVSSGKSWGSMSELNIPPTSPSKSS